MSRPVDAKIRCCWIGSCNICAAGDIKTNQNHNYIFVIADFKSYWQGRLSFPIDHRRNSHICFTELTLRSSNELWALAPGYCESFYQWDWYLPLSFMWLFLCVVFPVVMIHFSQLPARASMTWCEDQCRLVKDSAAFTPLCVNSACYFFASLTFSTSSTLSPVTLTEQLLEFMHQLPAFANMTMSVRRELCAVMVFAVVERAGTIVLNDGEEVCKSIYICVSLSGNQSISSLLYSSEFLFFNLSSSLLY